MTTMRAAILHDYNTPLVVHDNVLVEDPKAGEVLVKIGASGVCRSDVHSSEWVGVQPIPSLLGHEGAGTVVAVGPGVTELAIGDRVVLMWVAPCGSCKMCDRERPSLCEGQGSYELGFAVDGTSRYSLNGELIHHYSCSTFGEYSVVPVEGAIKVDTDLPWEYLALVGCAVTTGVGAAINTANVRPGDSVAVIGCGGVGLSVIQGARIAGASTIIAIDTNPGKLDLATELGATNTIDSSSVDAIEAVRKICPNGVDHAFEALGRENTIQQAIDMTTRGGQTTLIGMAKAEVRPSIPALDVVVEERTIAGSWYGSFVPARDIPKIVGWLETGDLKLDAIIERITLDDVNTAFDRIRSGEANRQVIIF